MRIDSLTLIEGSNITNLTVESGSAFPSNPNLGELFYKTSTTVGLYYHDGTSWNIVNSSNDLTTHASDMTLHLTSTQDTFLDAITVSAAEVNFLSGAAANIQGQIDDRLPKAGGTMTGALTLSGAPAADLHAATKKYVDDGLASVSSPVTLTGDVTGSGTGSISTTLADSGVTASTYKSVTVDAKGRVTAGTNPTTLSGFGITDGALSSDLTTHTGDASVHITSAQNTLLDGLDSNLTSAELNYVHGVTSDIQTQLDAKVAKSGSTMTGNLVMQTGTKITLTDSPSLGTDAANKSYVDGLATGLTWKAPVQLSNMVGTATSPVGSPVQPDAYIIGTGGNTGAWSSFAVGDAVQWSGGQWNLIKAVAIGDRYGVAFQNQTSPVGDFVGKLNYIATISGGTPGNWTYTWEAPVASTAVFVNNPNAFLFGHSYTYVSGSSSWVEFSGPTATGAGVGLSYSGNTMNINLGAGVAQLPTDEVGIDLYSASGLILTSDGSTASTATGAQLAVRLNGSTLDRSASGIKVAAGGITATEINSSALSSDLTGGSGSTIALSTTGVSGGTYKSVTVDTKGRVTAGTNPTTLSGYGITDAVKNLGSAPTMSSGVLGVIPAAGLFGQIYFATDTRTIYRDNSSTWDLWVPALTGDVTTSAGSLTTALSTTGVSAGTYNSVTVDTKGRVTAASNVTVSGNPNYLLNNQVGYLVTGSMAASSFSVAASHRAIVRSIHVTNITAASANLAAEIRYGGTTSVSIAANMPIPAGTSVELFERPHVLNPSDLLRFQSSVASALHVTITWEDNTTTSYFGTGAALSTTAMTDIYTSTSITSAVESVLLVNYDTNVNNDTVTVVWTDGSNIIQGYLCSDMIVPVGGTIELLQNPKFLASGYKIRASTPVANRVAVHVSGKTL